MAATLVVVVSACAVSSTFTPWTTETFEPVGEVYDLAIWPHEDSIPGDYVVLGSVSASVQEGAGGNGDLLVQAIGRAYVEGGNGLVVQNIRGPSQADAIVRHSVGIPAYRSGQMLVVRVADHDAVRERATVGDSAVLAEELAGMARAEPLVREVVEGMVWVGARSRGAFYPLDCRAWWNVGPADLQFFPSAEWAMASGFRFTALEMCSTKEGDREEG